MIHAIPCMKGVVVPARVLLCEERAFCRSRNLRWALLFFSNTSSGRLEPLPFWLPTAAKPVFGQWNTRKHCATGILEATYHLQSSLQTGEWSAPPKFSADFYEMYQ